MRKTKIVCTLGPASASDEIITEMLRAGMNVARLNFSHGTHESHAEMIARFRRLRDQLELPAAVMLDTKGPEVRLGDFKGGKIQVSEGASFDLFTEAREGDETGASISYAELPAQLKMGDRLMIDDGRVALRVTSVSEKCVHTTVECGGFLSNHKSVNVPNVPLPMPYLSEQDKRDLLFAVEKDVDFVSASFVRRKEDVVDLRKFLDFHGGHAIKIIAKIENNEGVEHFSEILEAADGIMVARGDMGVEIDYERLPGIQKQFIRRCYQAGKMVITATQMMESMVNSPRPTRAEITDVANAVFDGTSAVMLSGETAAGKYPVQAVTAMAKIAEQAEKDAFAMRVYQGIPYDPEPGVPNAICDAACTTALDIGAKAIIAVSKSGQTARAMSKFRPETPIVGATPEIKSFHQLSLSWGVYPVLALKQTTSDALFQHAVDCAKQLNLVQAGDQVVVAAGIPLDTPGNTNILRVQTV